MRPALEGLARMAAAILALAPALSPASVQTERRLALLPVETTTRLEDIQQSADGALLLTHDRGYNPKLWDARRIRLLAYLDGHQQPVSFARFSPTGAQILTLSEDQAIIWDARRALPKARVMAPKGDALALASWSADGSRCALATRKGAVAVAGLDGAASFGAPIAPEPTALALSPDGSLAVAAHGSGKLVCAAAAGAVKWSLQPHKSPVYWIHWAKDGRQVLSTETGGKAALISSSGALAALLDHQAGEKGAQINTEMGASFAGAKEESILACDAKGALRLHSRSQPSQSRNLPGNEAPVRELRLSPDGQKAATYSTDEALRIWDLSSGRQLPFTRPDDLPTAGEFSSDSQAFWIGSASGAIRRHDLASGAVKSVQPGAALSLTGFDWFQETGRLALTVDSSNGEAFNHSERGIVFTLSEPGHGTPLPSSSDGPWFAPTGRQVVAADSAGGEKTVLDLDQAGRETGKGSWTARGMSYSADESQLVIWQDQPKLVRLNPKTFEPESLIDFGAGENFVSASIANDGVQVAAAGWTNKEGKSRIIWAEFGKKEFYDFAPMNAPWCQVSFIKNDTQILIVDADRIALHDAATLAEIKVIKRTGGGSDSAFQLVRDRWLLVAGSAMTLYDLEEGKPVLIVNDQSGRTRLVKQLSEDGASVLSVQGRSLQLLEAATGRVLAKASTLSRIAEAGFLAGTDLVGAADTSEGLVLFSAKDLKRVGRVCFMSNGGWLAVDEEGRFDASDPNAVDGASYVLLWDGGREAIDVSQLKGQFYEPGLMAKMAGLDKTPKRAVPSLDSLRLPPLVKTAKGSGGRLEVELTERDGGGLGEAVIKVNGKVIERRLGSGFFKVDLSKAESLLLPQAALQKGESNWLTVTCMNEKGDLESPPETVDLGVPEGLKAPEVSLYALCVGVGDYVGQTGDLKAPPKDAEALAQGIRATGERLLPGRVHVEVLASGETAPTRAAVMDWLARTARTARSSDIVLVYFSGHGTSQIGSETGYFFLTSDCDPSSLSPSALGVSVVSGADLQAALAKVAANKQVVILDTCHSGAAAGDLISGRGPGSDYKRAYESLRDATGVWLLAGSASDQLSYESSQVDHGILTYSLLEAIDKATADGLRPGQDGELFVDVERWLSYAADRVESLKNEVGIKGVQRPEVRRSAARESFDIGVTKESLRGSLGLKPPKPVVLVASFDQDAEDPAGLEAAVGASLRLSEQIKPWFDIQKQPNVYRVAGSYVLNGADIKVKVVVQRLDQAMNRKTIEAFEASGSTGALSALADAIRAGVEKAILKAEEPARQPSP